MTTAGQIDNEGKPIQREGGIAADARWTTAPGTCGRVRPTTPAWSTTPVRWTGCSSSAAVGEDFASAAVGEPACDGVGSIDPSNLNYPSISVGDLAGKQTVTRTVTNATNQASVYVPKVEAPAGFTVKVTPSMLTVLPRKLGHLHGGDHPHERARSASSVRLAHAGRPARAQRAQPDRVAGGADRGAGRDHRNRHQRLEGRSR